VIGIGKPAAKVASDADLAGLVFDGAHFEGAALRENAPCWHVDALWEGALDDDDFKVVEAPERRTWGICRGRNLAC
jgi:hypothetical protein